jgi:hypothetical protein
VTSTESTGFLNSFRSHFSPYLQVFLTLSGIGFAVSLLINIASMMGRRIPPEGFLPILHIGVFVVWIPAVFLVKQKVGYVRGPDVWEKALKGSPDWMRYLLWTVFCYGFISFLGFAVLHSMAGSTDADFSEWRLFSDVWLMFYAAAFALFYAAGAEITGSSQCINGHAALRNANFCTQCGQPLRRSL